MTESVKLHAETEIAVVATFVPWVLGAKFAPGGIPLHVTVLSNFRIPSRGLAATLDSIRSVTASTLSTASLVAIGGASELFGPLRNIEVTTLIDAQLFVALHRRLLAVVESVGEAVEPSYQREGFRPHVTAVGRSGLGQGQRVRLDSVAVLDCTYTNRVVIDAFALTT